MYASILSISMLVWWFVKVLPEVKDPFQQSLLVFVMLIAGSLGWIENELEKLNKGKK